MAKEWKTIDYNILDILKRDCPCMIYNGQFYIGGCGSSHATLIQECILGMSFTKDYYELYYNLWNDKGNTEGIVYNRNEGMALIEEEDDSYCFGEVILSGRFKGVYWDIDYGDVKTFVEMIQQSCKDSDLPHYWFRKTDKTPLRINFD